MSDPKFRPTWDELQTAHNYWQYHPAQTEAQYKSKCARWSELVINGYVRFRGGTVKLTRRGYFLWHKMCCDRLDKTLRQRGVKE